MNSLPNNLKKIALFLERLPGIGEKTANRLAFYLLRLPERDLKDVASNLASIKSKTKLCKVCLNLTEDEICNIDTDSTRDHGVIIVVEEVLDLLSLETGNIYKGIYHVLHGKIDPLNHIGPEDIYIDKLMERIKNSLKNNGTKQSKNTKLKEIILALNPDLEGEATAMYIRDRLNEIKKRTGSSLRITRLAYGLPIGASLEYADYMTLRKAIEGRNNY
ncbi:recombination protein RecR [Candidatus Roizmanbacteria bacterium RIFCSPHIGHO2_02_FULL_37_15]|uniref:Recombination protein RecR n=1 Tax=Candidatus Roizmanbacteria bacterium RIFCSPLOWO2_01_FULL_37_16 TaxID=1802058 RepID=A0A1F7IQI3_9BACT|nr:MAG: recombination protein RecR [Candidatus Roizmanbacteria bacterium RIFCSPHIGHO2_01_FULL_37_16b]OGK21140.1 MAG: recombination protein RecR [Candidatus Roizmanbacteria bacterium RIFCSPHIGHO2_02_FULL_37_15]OGK32751.1 MAG: recombination protein RecR [Candidatus Roizmanbacteria bacterium RIFCSPHIGHO2_12_FULL_36_11]OGK45618.1 MAG: recombination protein RecR [Candidatus Roizmanbacteria bacterium RIFCSPLOWO2_01_FULL_37_16]OGK56647.1 MAG: recombination protein RecR [Candidatus Roizmanbacteria bact